MIISGVDYQHDPESRRAAGARRWFRRNGPPDLQPLPLGYAERERLKNGSARHILAWYARSLAEQDYDVRKHPSFYDYACGVMASQVIPRSMAEDQELLTRFPPRPLEGLDSHLYWEPPVRPRASVLSRRSRTRKALH